MKKPANPDTLYRSPNTQLVDFVFDAAVVDVFPDMIRRSVPAYETVVPMTALLAGRQASPGSNVYDLGCSRGATTLALQRYCDPNCRIVGVDNSQPMIDAARQVEQNSNEAQPSALASTKTNTPVVSPTQHQSIEWRCEDIRTAILERAGAVTMTYTLQFIPPTQRGDLLARIYAGLLPGGALVYAEKVVLEPAADQDYFDAAHLDFKRANGYSDLEVAQKRAAIENVMQPDTLATHTSRLHRIGFDRVNTWFQCLNWAAFIAIK